MSKEVESKNDEIPRAYVSLTGQIIECNREFARICGIDERQLNTTSLASLAKHPSPESAMESAFLLDQVSSEAKGGPSCWRAKLAACKDSKHDEYEIIASHSGMRINGQKVLEATVDLAESQSKKLRRNFIKAVSEEISQFIPLQVLLVEDSPTALKLMARMVQRLGHIVTTASDGVEALDLMKQQKFDLVVMDVNMPRMNGLDTSNEFRKIEKARGLAPSEEAVKIIAMSADMSNTLYHEVSNAGFDAFVPKPLTVESFKEVLKQMKKLQ